MPCSMSCPEYAYSPSSRSSGASRSRKRKTAKRTMTLSRIQNVQCTCRRLAAAPPAGSSAFFCFCCLRVTVFMDALPADNRAGSCEWLLMRSESRPQNVVFVHWPIICESRGHGRFRDKRVHRQFALQQITEAIFRAAAEAVRRRRVPLDEIGSGRCRHLLRELFRRLSGDRTVTGQKVNAELFGKGSHVRKRILQGSRHCRDVHGILFRTSRNPLLQNSSWAQALPRHRVKFARVKQARTGRLQRRRRIDRDHIVGFGRSLEIAAAVVNDHARQWRSEYRLGIGVIIAKKFRNTRHQFDRGNGYSPRTKGAKGCAHPEADHESVLWRTVQKCQWQMRHRFGDGRQIGHSEAIHEQL